MSYRTPYVLRKGVFGAEKLDNSHGVTPGGFRNRTSRQPLGYQ